MRESVLQRLCCAVCRGPLQSQGYQLSRKGEIDEGVAWCETCQYWYPIEKGVLELLPPALAYVADRKRFWEAHHRELRALGLEIHGIAAGPLQVEPQRKQQQHFDWYASNETQTYNTYHQMPFWEAEDTKTFGAWRGLVRPGQWILDVGCAEGRATFQLMDLPVNIVGFDISKALIHQAVAKYRARDYGAEATFFVGDGSCLPFRPQSFDCIMIYGVLHHLPEPRETCRQLAEILKPGGLYLGSENNQTVFRGLFDFLMKINPLWHEEAGAQPLISARNFHEWFSETSVNVETETHVFVPPHLVNLLGKRWGGWLLRGADILGQRIPILCKNGGLIVVRGQRGADATSLAEKSKIYAKCA